MKKLLSLFVIIIAATNARAQSPTITGAGVNPVAGDIIYAHKCDTNGANNGAAAMGAGVTWDLTALSVYGDDTIKFLSCASTPYCDSFPGSNIATDDGFGGYDYFISDANKFAHNGYASGGTDAQYYTDPSDFFMHPTTYGNVKVDTSVSTQPQLGWSYYSVDSFIADAYGTLKLPGGTYSSVLRVHVISHNNDSDASGSTHMLFKTERYMWLAEGVHFPLLMMFYDTSAGVRFLSDLAYYTHKLTGVNEVAAATEALQVYPNPASGTVNISYDAKNEGRVAVTLTDMSGRTVLVRANEQVKKGGNTLSYSMAGIPVGAYVLRIQTATELATAKVMVVE